MCGRDFFSTLRKYSTEERVKIILQLEKKKRQKDKYQICQESHGLEDPQIYTFDHNN